MAGARIDLAGLADVLTARAAETGKRVLAAVAGAPGSGKSTQAEALCDLLNARRAGMAAVLPMDGFHYDDLYLVPAGLRARKGAPETFDVGGLYHTLTRIRAADDSFVAVPVFDRDIEIARAGARMIAADVPVIVVEGNYLLLDQAPWSRLRPLFDVTVLVEVPQEVLRARLVARWKGYGLSDAEIHQKVEGNDMPNGRFVIDHSQGAEFILPNG